MIGLPHRGHRPLDGVAHLPAPAPGEHLPQPGAEVRPGEHGVGAQPEDDQQGGRLGETHGAPSPPSSRGARAMRRSIQIAIAVRPAYTLTSTTYPTGMPSAPVTASSTRIRS